MYRPPATCRRNRKPPSCCRRKKRHKCRSQSVGSFRSVRARRCVVALRINACPHGRRPPRPSSPPLRKGGNKRCSLPCEAGEGGGGGGGGQAFNSFFNSFKNRQLVPCAISLFGGILIMPTSCKRSAKKRSVSSGFQSRQLLYGRLFITSSPMS